MADATTQGCEECSPIPHEGGYRKCECVCHDARAEVAALQVAAEGLRNAMADAGDDAPAAALAYLRALPIEQRMAAMGMEPFEDGINPTTWQEAERG